MICQAVSSGCVFARLLAFIAQPSGDNHQELLKCTKYLTTTVFDAIEETHPYFLFQNICLNSTHSYVFAKALSAKTKTIGMGVAYLRSLMIASLHATSKLYGSILYH